MLGEQRQQPVDDDGALAQAGVAEAVGAEQVERAPDELEVEAQGEHPAREAGLAQAPASGRRATASSMFEVERPQPLAETRASVASQRAQEPGQARGGEALDPVERTPVHRVHVDRDETGGDELRAQRADAREVLAQRREAGPRRAADGSRCG